MDRPSPPRSFLRFFKWFCDPDLHPFIEGDLHELYHERVQELGKKKADRRFAWDVLLLFRPGIIRNFQMGPFQNAAAMFKHNFLVAFRNFKRRKMAFLINLLGLATGLTCVLLIYLWVHDERQMDQFHGKKDQLYQVMQHFERPDGIETQTITPAKLAEALPVTIPEVKAAVSMNNFYYCYEEGMLTLGEKKVKAKGVLASKDFFKLFSFPLLQGHPDRALADKNGLIITERLARKVFNTTDNLIGTTIDWEQKIVDWSDNFLEGPFQISGIVADPPPNSSLQFDVIANYEHLPALLPDTREWYSDAADTYLLLREGVDIEQFNRKITELLQSKHPDREYCTLSVQPYTTRYLHGSYENGVQAGGRIAYVRLFSLIALFILAIACINFMNLATARASVRMKEVGVKKVSGASRMSLVFQFLQESMLMASLAAILATLAMFLLLPTFNQITGKELSFAPDARVGLTIFGLVLLTGLIAGSYPAFYLSGFRPVAILKGKLNAAFGEKWLRQGLVFLQFALSIVFIGGFLILNRQMAYVQQKQLGYRQDQIICFSSKGKNTAGIASFMEAVRNLSGVAQATNIWGGSFLQNKNFSVAPDWEGKQPDQTMIVPRPHVGYDFIETLGLELVMGRSFSRNYGNEESKVILNEAALDLIGYQEPLGKLLTRGDQQLEIIGVVKNFHSQSLHEPIKPTFIRFLPDGNDIMVRIRAGREAPTLEQIGDLYEAFHSGYPFEFTFMDAEYRTLYEAERRGSTLSNYFAAVAILVSCLGLFGLAAFTVERRRKEIGIRKVLGAGVYGIVRLLSGHFAWIVLGSILVALPVTYLIAQTWLANFAYHVELQWWFFLLPGILTLFIAGVTVSVHTIRAARINPALSLKNE